MVYICFQFYPSCWRWRQEWTFTPVTALYWPVLRLLMPSTSLPPKTIGHIHLPFLLHCQTWIKKSSLMPLLVYFFRSVTDFLSSDTIEDLQGIYQKVCIFFFFTNVWNVKQRQCIETYSLYVHSLAALWQKAVQVCTCLINWQVIDIKAFKRD